MGNRSAPMRSKADINAYFLKKEREQMKKFSKIEGYMENSGEWISYIRERLESLDTYWAKELLQFVDKWDARSDRGSKAGLVWLRYIDNSSLRHIRTKTRTNFQGIESRYSAFEFTVFSNMYKSLLYAQLTRDDQHILYRMNIKFASSLETQYKEVIDKLMAEKACNAQEFIENIELDVNSYIVLLIEIMPKFYPQIITNVSKVSLEPIIRNSMVSGELFGFLVKAFNAAYLQENKRFYNKARQHRLITFTDIGYPEELSLNNGAGYTNAINGLEKVFTSDRLVTILDSIGFLEYDISNSIDEFYPEGCYSLTADDLIPIFMILLTRASTQNLPAYIQLVKKVARTQILPVELSYLIQIIESAMQSVYNLQDQ